MATTHKTQKGMSSAQAYILIEIYWDHIIVSAPLYHTDFYTSIQIVKTMVSTRASFDVLKNSLLDSSERMSFWKNELWNV